MRGRAIRKEAASRSCLRRRINLSPRKKLYALHLEDMLPALAVFAFPPSSLIVPTLKLPPLPTHSMIVLA